MSDELTLYVDLMHTALDDFAEHIKEEIFRLAYLIAPSFRHIEGGVQWEREPRDQGNLIIYRWPVDIDEENWSWVLKSEEDDGVHGYIIVRKFAAVQYEWNVHYPNQSEGWGFTLVATHYRRDRLNLALWESSRENPIVGNSLMQWLQQYWRTGGVLDLLASGENPPVPPRANDAPNYEDEIRAAAYPYDADAKKRWQAAIQVHAAWRQKYPKEVTHKRLAAVMGVEEPHAKRMWGQYRPDRNPV